MRIDKEGLMLYDFKNKLLMKLPTDEHGNVFLSLDELEEMINKVIEE